MHATTTLQGYSPQFLQYYASSDPEAPEPPSPTSDVGFGAQQSTLEDLGCAIFDFLTPAVRQKGVETTLGGRTQAEHWSKNVVELVLLYTRVTRSNVSDIPFMPHSAHGQEEEWMEDANNFIEDDDEETEMYGLRLTGHDLIGVS
jgi:importin-9